MNIDNKLLYLFYPVFAEMIPYDGKKLRCDPMWSQVVETNDNDMSIGSGKVIAWNCSACEVQFTKRVQYMYVSCGRCKTHTNVLRGTTRIHYDGGVPRPLLRPIRAGVLQHIDFDSLAALIATLEPVPSQCAGAADPAGAALAMARGHVESIAAGNYTRVQLLDSVFWGDDTVTRKDGSRYVRPPQSKKKRPNDADAGDTDNNAAPPAAGAAPVPIKRRRLIPPNPPVATQPVVRTADAAVDDGGFSPDADSAPPLGEAGSPVVPFLQSCAPTTDAVVSPSAPIAPVVAPLMGEQERPIWPARHAIEARHRCLAMMEKECTKKGQPITLNCFMNICVASIGGRIHDHWKDIAAGQLGLPAPVSDYRLTKQHVNYLVEALPVMLKFAAIMRYEEKENTEYMVYDLINKAEDKEIAVLKAITVLESSDPIKTLKTVFPPVVPTTAADTPTHLQRRQIQPPVAALVVRTTDQAFEGGSQRIIHMSVYRGNWHHICVSIGWFPIFEIPFPCFVSLSPSVPTAMAVGHHWMPRRRSVVLLWVPMVAMHCLCRRLRVWVHRPTQVPDLHHQPEIHRGGPSGTQTILPNRCLRTTARNTSSVTSNRLLTGALRPNGVALRTICLPFLFHIPKLF